MNCIVTQLQRHCGRGIREGGVQRQVTTSTIVWTRDVEGLNNDNDSGYEEEGINNSDNQDIESTDLLLIT